MVVVLLLYDWSSCSWPVVVVDSDATRWKTYNPWIYIYIYLYFFDIFITWSIDLPDRAERFDDYLWLDGPILFLILI